MTNGLSNRRKVMRVEGRLLLRFQPIDTVRRRVDTPIQEVASNRMGETRTPGNEVGSMAVVTGRGQLKVLC